MTKGTAGLIPKQKAAYRTMPGKLRQRKRSPADSPADSAPLSISPSSSGAASVRVSEASSQVIITLASSVTLPFAFVFYNCIDLPDRPCVDPSPHVPAAAFSVAAMLFGWYVWASARESKRLRDLGLLTSAELRVTAIRSTVDGIRAIAALSKQSPPPDLEAPASEPDQSSQLSDLLEHHQKEIKKSRASFVKKREACLVTKAKARLSRDAAANARTEAEQKEATLGARQDEQSQAEDDQLDMEDVLVELDSCRRLEAEMMTECGGRCRGSAAEIRLSDKYQQKCTGAQLGSVVTPEPPRGLSRAMDEFCGSGGPGRSFVSKAAKSQLRGAIQAAWTKTFDTSLARAKASHAASEAKDAESEVAKMQSQVMEASLQPSRYLVSRSLVSRSTLPPPPPLPALTVTVPVCQRWPLLPLGRRTAAPKPQRRTRSTRRVRSG